MVWAVKVFRRERTITVTRGSTIQRCTAKPWVLPIVSEALLELASILALADLLLVGTVLPMLASFVFSTSALPLSLPARIPARQSDVPASVFFGNKKNTLPVPIETKIG